MDASTGLRPTVERSPVFLPGAVALLAAVATLAVVLLPFLRFAYRAPALHVMLETVNAVVALLVAYLVYGRFRETRRLQTLLLLVALCTVAAANLVLAAIPSAVMFGRSQELSSWAPLGVRLLGTLLLFAAAVSPLAARISRRRTLLLICSLTAVVAAVGVSGLAWGGHLPVAVDPALLGDGSRPRLVAHPAVLAAQAVGVVLYGVASVAFTRQAARTGDELIRWVGAGCVLAAFARLHYLVFPSLYSEFVYTGDVFRLGCYLLMLVGAAREITSYWHLRTHAAVVEDRRRMARDLHDGLTQELSYLWAQSRRLSNHPGDRVLVEQIGGAAERAIDESRRAIAALTRTSDGPLAATLSQATREMAGRYDTTIRVQADDDVQVDGPMSDAVLRVTGEAVRNAVRHGKASSIEVTLTATPLSLTVTDDGCGFCPDDRRRTAGGFGLTSMHERAESVGATLAVESVPGEGTTVRMGWS